MKSIELCRQFQMTTLGELRAKLEEAEAEWGFDKMVAIEVKNSVADMRTIALIRTATPEEEAHERAVLRAEALSNDVVEAAKKRLDEALRKKHDPS